MTGPDLSESNIHPIALLLPWYVNGSLSEHERRQCDEHLTMCASCRAELTELQVIRAQVREASAEPSTAQFTPDTFRIAKAQLAQSVLSATRPATAPDRASTGLLDAAARALRSVFAPQWMPAAALALVLVQSGALVWYSQRATQSGEITTRGLASPTTRLQLTFQPAAAEQDIRQLLLEVHAHIVAGPSAGGVYVVEVQSNDPVRVAQKLAALRARTELVRVAEQATP